MHSVAHLNMLLLDQQGTLGHLRHTTGRAAAPHARCCASAPASLNTHSRHATELLQRGGVVLHVRLRLSQRAMGTAPALSACLAEPASAYLAASPQLTPQWYGTSVFEFWLQIGLRVPKCFRVESSQQVRDLNSNSDKLGSKKYLLKSIPYDPAHRGDLFTLPAKPTEIERWEGHNRGLQHLFALQTASVGAVRLVSLLHMSSSR